MKINKLLINLSAILLILYAINILYKDYKNSLKINEKKGIVLGRVKDYYVVFPDNRYIEYEFSLNNRSYRAKEQIPLGVGNCWEIGDFIRIEYYLNDPKLSQIDFKCKVSNSTNGFPPADSIKCDKCY